MPEKPRKKREYYLLNPQEQFVQMCHKNHVENEQNTCYGDKDLLNI